MANWTKKSFDDLPDVSPKDVRIQWRFAREELESPELGVSRFTYEAGPDGLDLICIGADSPMRATTCA